MALISYLEQGHADPDPSFASKKQIYKQREREFTVKFYR
jgi:hypothetical protein